MDTGFAKTGDGCVHGCRIKSGMTMLF